MKIKCRGYCGDLLSLNGIEKTGITSIGLSVSEIPFYDLEILAEDGAKISLYGVLDNEIIME